jgi:hypothetical protein
VALDGRDGVEGTKQRIAAAILVVDRAEVAGS